MIKKAKKNISCIVVLVFLLVILISSFLIIIHLNHECAGENCTICMSIAECHNNLNMLDNTVVVSFYISLIILSAFELERIINSIYSNIITLISLKVEFLN